MMIYQASYSLAVTTPVVVIFPLLIFLSEGFVSLPTMSRFTSFATVRFAEQTEQPPILVVGKIIVDEYGDPSVQDDPVSVTVGGGAPQAAMGAALALAARDRIQHKEEGTKNNGHFVNPPPAQPVTLLAAAGDLDFSLSEDYSLYNLLKDALQTPPIIVRGSKLKTPRIRLWHDENQVLQWYPLNDSFGPEGAGGLWGNYPSVQDYEKVLSSLASGIINTSPILHIIIEGSISAPGNNGDSNPLMSPSLSNAISFLGLEPITFPNEKGVVSEEDAKHCGSLLQNIFDANDNKRLSAVISPDMHLHLAMLQSNCLPKSAVNENAFAVRDGPRGSILVEYQYNPDSMLGGNDPLLCQTDEKLIPAAELTELVNPTGAGNAYAAAYTALRGSGMDPVQSACIANSVGAVFCEHSHCPTYSWDVIERIVEMSRRILQNVKTEKTLTRRYGEEQKRIKGIVS